MWAGLGYYRRARFLLEVLFIYTQVFLFHFKPTSRIHAYMITLMLKKQESHNFFSPVISYEVNKNRWKQTI